MRRLAVLSVVVLVAGVVVSLAAGSGSAAGRWVIRDLGTLGGEGSGAVDVNERGQVVGWSDTARKSEGVWPIIHAFLWQDGRMRDLGVLSDRYEESQAVSLNDRGEVVGTTSTRAGNRAFLWENGRMRDLGTLRQEATSSEAVAINRAGMVVGYDFVPSGDSSESSWSAFVWQEGRMTGLGGDDARPEALNDRGEVLVSAADDWFLWNDGTRSVLRGDFYPQGSSLNDRGQVAGSVPGRWAAVWENGKTSVLGRLTRGHDCAAIDLNERGRVVGYCGARGYKAQPVLWRGRAPVRIDVVFGDRGTAVAVNDDGQVVGFSTWLRPRGSMGGFVEVRHAFVWEDGRTTDLGTLPGGTSSRATAINQRGQIIGSATTKTGQRHAVLWTKTG